MSEEQNILDMSDDEIVYMSPEQAQGHIDRLMREARADPKHVYSDSHNAGHKKAVEKIQRLYEKVSPQPELQLTKEGASMTQFSREHIQIMEQALDEQAGKTAEIQAKLINEAEAEMEKLVELGFNDDDIPEDIKPYQVDGLRMQRLTAEKKFLELTPLIEKQLKNLNTPSSLVSMFQTFALEQDVDETLKERIAEQLVSWIYEANKQRYGEK